MSTKHTNPFKQVAAFNQACGNLPDGPFGSLSRLYINLFREEAQTEFEAAVAKLDAIEEPGKDLVAEVEAIAELADAYIDSIVIAAGALYVMGLDPVELWAEVQRANNDKVGQDGKVTKREDGKILKPEGWQPPQIKALVAKQLGYVKRVGKDLDAQLAAKVKSAETVAEALQQASLVERMFSVEQAAAMCGLGITFIRQEIAAGTLKHKKFGANTIRIPESALAAYQKG